jgi:hypothetical protein
MDQIVNPAEASTLERSQNIVRPPARMTHRSATERRGPRHFIAIERDGAHGLLNLSGQCRPDPFIGIDQKHPIALRQRQRVIEPLPKTIECMDANTRTPASALRTVSSSLPVLTIIRSSQNATLSRQSAILADSFLAMMIAPRLGMPLTRNRDQRFDFAPVTAGSRIAPDRRTSALVEWPGMRSTRTTLPPLASTRSRPTTSSIR